MANTSLCCLILAVFLTNYANSVYISRPDACEQEETLFKHGYSYTYKYRLETSSGLKYSHPNVTDKHTMVCDVILNVPHPCEILLAVTECLLGHSPYPLDLMMSSKLSKEMNQSPLYFKYSKGEVIDHNIFVNEDEPVYITNLKRGIVSLIQLKNFALAKKFWKFYENHDTLGSCKTQIKVVHGKDHQIETRKDLSSCKTKGTILYQNLMMSAIKTMQNDNPAPPLTQMMNPVFSNVKCHHNLNPDWSLKSAYCLQENSFSPLVFSGQLISNVSQSLQFESSKPLKTGYFQRFLSKYKITDLEMDSDSEDEIKPSKGTVERALEVTVTDSSTEKIRGTSPAQSFKNFVSLLRRAKDEQLMAVKDSTYSCLHGGSCLKFRKSTIESAVTNNLKQRLFVKGLMSCGTDPCLLLLFEMLKTNLIKGFEGKYILYNSGLFYHPSLKVMEKVFDIWSGETQDAHDWLALSAMLNRLTLAEPKKRMQVERLLNKAIKKFQGFIGTKCYQPSVKMSPAKKLLREKYILISLKGLSNLGKVPDSYKDSKTLNLILMDCVLNTHEDIVIAQSAVQVLSKTGFLNNHTDKLMKLLEDDKVDISLRTTIFDAYIFEDNKKTLKLLLAVLKNTKLNTMKTYMVTKIASILESPNPNLFRLKSVLQDILQKDVLPDVRKILSKSHYAEVSHNFKIPLTPLNLGAELGISVIFTPASNLLETFSVKSRIIMDGKTVDFLQITVFLEGFDTVMDMIKELQSNSSMSGFQDFMKHLITNIQVLSKGKVPHFEQLNPVLMNRIAEMFMRSNMKKFSLPRGHISIKIMGYDIFFLSTESLLKLAKEKRSFIQNKGPDVLLKSLNSYFIEAFKFSDFHQSVPTLSGLQLKFNHDNTILWNSKINCNGKTKTINFKTKKFSTDLSVLPRISMLTDASISLGLHDYFMTGIKHETSFVGIISLSANMKMELKFSKQIPDIHINISKAVEKGNFTFLDARSRTFYPSKKDETIFDRGESSWPSVKKCLPEIYTKLFGHEMCLEGYHEQISSEKDQTFPRLESSRMIGNIIPQDKELKNLEFSISHQRPQTMTGVYHTQVNLEGRGVELSRNVSAYFQHDVKELESGCAMRLMIDDIDADLIFITSNKRGRFSNSTEISLKIYQNETTTLSFNSKQERSADKKTRLVIKELTKANITTLGGDLSVAFFWKKSNYSITSHGSLMELRYHCKPSLPLLYYIHPNPALANKFGYTSVFFWSQESDSTQTSFAQTWTGTYKDKILIPGHNITHSSKFVADLTGANKTTKVMWMHGRKKHIYHINGQVVNQTAAGVKKYIYKMHLVKLREYIFDYEGHITLMPRSGCQIKLQLNYESLRSKSKRNTITGFWNVWEKKKGLFAGKQGKEFSVSKYKALNTKNNSTRNKKKNPLALLVSLPKWDLTLSADVNQELDIVKIGENMNVRGALVNWLANVTMFKGKKVLLLTKGFMERGKKLTSSWTIEDNVHHFVFTAGLEHTHNKETFSLCHKWNLVEKNLRAQNTGILDDDLHVSNRSFEFQTHFRNFHHFEVDMKLKTYLTNITYYLNYTKSSANAHMVRAKAFFRSHVLPLTLDYDESSDILDGQLDTKVQMTSNFLDWNLTLSKSPHNESLDVNGNLQYRAKWPFHSEYSQIVLHVSNGHKPVCIVTYFHGDENDGIETSIVLHGPKRISFIMSSVLDQNNSESKNTLFTWSLALIGPRVIQLTFRSTPRGIGIVQHMVHHFTERLKQRFDETNRVIGYSNIKDKSVQDISIIKLKRLLSRTPTISKVNSSLGGVQSWNYFVKKFFTGTALHEFNIEEGIASSVNLSIRLLKKIVHEQPFFLQQFAKLYIYPDIHALKNGKDLKISLSLPFVWKSFIHSPEGTLIDKEIMEEMKITRFPISSPYRDLAVLLDGRWIRTFDGRWFDFQAPKGNACVHLLCGDFKRNKFIMLYSKTEGLTVLSEHDGLNVKESKVKGSGSISSLDGKPIRSLPYITANKELMITIQEGKFSLTVSNVARVSFDFEQKLFLFETSKDFNNASLGLLGSNNRESGDDFRLFNGSDGESSLTFQSKYELSQDKNCLVSKNSFTSHNACHRNSSSSSICHKVFYKNFKESPCVLHIDPKPFIVQCQTDECLGNFNCQSLHAYAAACSLLGMKTKTPTCGTQDQRSYNAETDIVFIQSLDKFTVDKEKNAFGIAQTFLNSLAMSKIRFGCITYGGKGPFKEPKAHLMNNRLMETVSKSKGLTYPSLPFTPETSVSSPEEAIEMAVNYPFRAESSHFIVLISSPQAGDWEFLKSELVETLKRREIHVLSVSELPEHESQGVLGVLYNGRIIGNQDKLDYLSKEMLSKLVKETRGAWLSKNAITKKQTGDLQRLIRQLPLFL